MRALQFSWSLLILQAASCLQATHARPDAWTRSNSSWPVSQQSIIRDVVIIGGGSAGTYAAIRLRQMNYSVVVIEKEDHLGGHVNTYTEPTTGIAADYGVLYFEDKPWVRDYFAYVHVPVVKVSVLGQGVMRRVDMRTGASVPLSDGTTIPAMAAYAAQLLKYPYLNTGFNLPDPVPEDLLLPFGEFIRKYRLDGAVDIIALFNQGVGDLLQQLTLYMMKYFSLGVLRDAIGGFLQPASHNNSELYGAAQRELGGDALLSSTVTATNRDDGGEGGEDDWIHLQTRTPTGEQTIQAKKLIVAIQPKLENLAAIDLDPTERDLFGQFHNTNYYTSLAHVPGLPVGSLILNRATDTPYHLPPQPAVYVMRPTQCPNLTSILYGSVDHMSEEEVKRHMTQSVLQLRHGGIPVQAPEFVAYSDHVPFLLTVSADAIRGGFYRELNALQGRRNTYYMSASLNTHDSAEIWRFIDQMLRTHFLQPEE
ncbi:amine oxidase, flavin-containing superfamily [Aspergillus brunneoviolaceus CBS 621.78]|uniref:Amine oxidase, flavin-containing superfamily n=1 Tax=Aspergillus brunneoviolaceus CBS 621.78 TaxID=1450534 RepID=A0ACD1GI15_9EURO|nr:amine oxidase, flavin-containing superfamily [Aspergillus brunneoviolaceus CBS 621.78]RAH48798.1 amine oxidase, flavin-containing superfamily [Aspergillus brunneoviolaceus CBS 621.78]